MPELVWKFNVDTEIEYHLAIPLENLYVIINNRLKNPRSLGCTQNLLVWKQCVHDVGVDLGAQRTGWKEASGMSRRRRDTVIGPGPQAWGLCTPLSAALRTPVPTLALSQIWLKEHSRMCVTGTVMKADFSSLVEEWSFDPRPFTHYLCDHEPAPKASLLLGLSC